MRPVLALTTLCLCCLLLPLEGAAQDRAVVRGRVLDPAGRPIEGAVVMRLASDAAPPILTSSSGRFVLAAAPGERLLTVRIGYQPDTLVLGSPDDDLRIVLEPAALTLATLQVLAPRALAHDRQLQALRLALRPRNSAQDLLRVVPGVTIAQHAGGGKPEQLFLRGFDADHGTDVAVSVDGTPINLVSHAHGQGYADLHFLPPEVVEAVEISRGGLGARDGNLATAGAIRLTTRDRMPGWFEMRAGAFGARAVQVALPVGGGAGSWGGYLTGGRQRADGPFLAPQGFERGHVFGRASGPVGAATELIVTGSAYQAEWMASGQVPERAVRAGTIPRFGAIDSTEGGSTGRMELSLAVRHVGAARRLTLRGFAYRSDLTLFSNFTFALRNPADGDGIEQVDQRTVGGLSAIVETHAGPGIQGRGELGATVRADAIDVLLAGQRDRRRLHTLAASEISEVHGSAWASQELQLGPMLIGAVVRADQFRFAVTDRSPMAAPDGVERPRPAGVRSVTRISPRIRADLPLTTSLVLTAGAGSGFHSNDARDVVLAAPGEETVPRSTTAQAGLRLATPRLSAGLTTWGTDLQSELVFVGDEAVVEPSGRTRRVGLELEMQAQLRPWLWADGELNLVRARFRDAAVGEDRVPLAPGRTATVGVLANGGNRWTAAVRLRHMASRPADERGEITALGQSLLEVTASWRMGCARVVAVVENALNQEWNEAQFATTSRLPGESGPVTELHFTPGSPRGVTLAIRWGCDRSHR